MAAIAEVAVENTVYHFDKTFSYFIPQNLCASAKTGCRVVVPFGAANVKRQGIILKVEDGVQSDKLKAIFSVLDKEPLLTDETIGLVFWIKEHCFCTLFEAAKLFFPAGIRFKIKTCYALVKTLSELENENLENDERDAVRYFIGKRKPVWHDKLLKDLSLPADSTLPERLLEKGIIAKMSNAVRQVGDATKRMVRFVERESVPKLTPSQKRVYDVLSDAGCASVKEVCYFAGVTQSVVNAVAAKGLAEYYEAEVYRNPYHDVPDDDLLREIVLTGEQNRAFQNLRSKYDSGKGGVSLLFGVTGSGKTSVFMRLIDCARKDARGVIVMVPEISLTPQTVSLFHRRYGACVAVFHSGLTLAERLDEWKRVKAGDATIVVGTRSAVFAPFKDIGLIIMDEEQEGTYKSESSPRYHARDIAKYRAAYHHALLVLSSATPSVVSYYNALSGRYGLDVLTQRYGVATLPEVKVVDMNAEVQSGNAGIFSTELSNAIIENFKNKKQSILLLNRRGYHTFVSCRSCGHVMTCPNCSISLTYHSANNRLMCHYCGFSVPFTDECPNCHAKKMHYSGFGTQKAEKELEEMLPDARILRLDADSTMTRFSYDKKLKQFSDGEYDIIIGTQMVAKGLDFENVTLAGVLSADQALYGDDFRSYERAFDLLTQVVGRSGRGKYKGRAIIQTFTPENEIISLAARQDYPAFYNGEIALRRSMLYPPFSDICAIGFVGAKENMVKEASESFLKLLSSTAKNEYKDQPLRVLNPSPALICKVSNKYRYKLIIKCRDNKRLRRMVSELLIRFSSVKEYSKVTVFADMNPENIM